MTSDTAAASPHKDAEINLSFLSLRLEKFRNDSANKFRDIVDPTTTTIRVKRRSPKGRVLYLRGATSLAFYSLDILRREIISVCGACFNNEDEDGLLRNLSALTFNIPLLRSPSIAPPPRLFESLIDSKGYPRDLNFFPLLSSTFFHVFDDEQRN